MSVKDAANNRAYTLYDAMDQPCRIWGARAQPVEFGYNAIGLRTTMTTWCTGSVRPHERPHL